MKKQIKDLRANLPGFAIDTFLDVGANVGQTVATVVEKCPEARVHAVEPIAASYEALSKRFREDARVQCYQVALGAINGTATMRARGTSTGNAVISDRRQTSACAEQVSMMMGDVFCEEFGIPRVSYLKIDTEGYDLEVLKGFESMLERMSIDLLQVEASMNDLNRKHVDLQEFRGFLEPRGYRLFGVYEQARELDGRPVLRRANAVFISDTCVRAHASSR